MVNRITGNVNAVAKRQYESFTRNVESKIGTKFVPRTFNLPSQKAPGLKRSQSVPAVTSKRQRTESLVTSPVAKVTPPPPTTYTCIATSSASARRVEMADRAGVGSLTVTTSHCPSPLILAIRASENPGMILIPVGMSSLQLTVGQQRTPLGM